MEVRDHITGGNGYHVPVMLKEAIDALNIKPDGVYVDCTFGGGGHSKAMLDRLGNHGKLYVFDQDEDAKTNLPDDTRIVFLPYNFRHIGRILRLHEVSKVDGILADLGVSSHQFDEGERGFSIRFNAALDMRMDQRQSITAAQLLMEKSEEELVQIFSEYGEVTNSKTLARTIVAYRSSVPLQTIQQFKDAVQQVVKGNPNKYFAQVFQALRIAVNDEMGALKELLEQVPEYLSSGGRIAVITFHSLEDRLVKNFFRSGSFEDEVPDEIYGTRRVSPFTVVTKKPIVPTEKEVKMNARSRSAKLRIAEKK
ncbi:MAG: 16S rRNA (cytosine(1402)-N(4))-methyltransferase RsmH [Chitinophagaceae bacterium]